MKITLRCFESDWVGVSIAMTSANVDLFVEKLLALKAGTIGHFHVRTNDFDGEPNVADIEICLTDEPDTAFSIE